MIDSHIHLTHERYKEDINEVISSAKAKGVKSVVLIGCDETGIKESVELAKKDPNFFGLAVGWHPVDVRYWNEQNKQLLLQTIEEEKVIAIGEMGLDYYWYPEEMEAQKELFEYQVKLAKEKNLPIIIHAREAYDDCFEILEKYAPIRGVMHSYADLAEKAQRFIDLGMYIGLSGPITFKNGYNQKETAKVIDLDKILLETDGPYLTPVPFRGKRNMPQYIEYIAEEIALQKGVDKDMVINQTIFNTQNLFGSSDV